MTELARIQGMIDLCCELLKNARTDKGRSSLVKQLSYYLKRKKELEHAINTAGTDHQPLKRGQAPNGSVCLP
jgi:hypothetical protein